ncbi:MAG: thiamine diphosphokinase [Myxococcales bacterium]|nr:thiamine diphosphokinase [Myxococcales bacterium]USN50501.1 MAG: thiamine diphosphokinase [Myxococcales bacterium]
MYPFPSKQFTLIAADGQKPSPHFFLNHLKHASSLLAADGAASWCFDHNFSPDLVIGDMDSCSRLTIPFVHVEDQNSNDLEKVFKYCMEKNLKNLLVMGAFGLRADHFLTNIFVLNKYSLHLNIFFIDDQQMAFICPPNKHLLISGSNLSYFSLYPLAHQVGPINTEGVLYPLKNEYLSIHNSLGTLNKISHNTISLRCQSQNLLVLLPFDKDLVIECD